MCDLYSEMHYEVHFLCIQLMHDMENTWHHTIDFITSSFNLTCLCNTIV